LSSRRNTIGWSAAGLWSSQVVSLVTVMILGRLLGPTAYGIAGYVSIFTAFSQIIFTDGFSNALLVKAPDENRTENIVFFIQLSTGCALSAIFFAYSYVPFLGAPSAQSLELLRLASVIPILHSVSSVYSDLLRRDMHFSRWALRNFVGAIVILCVGITLAVLGFGAASIVWMLVAQWVCTVFILFTGHNWRPAISLSHWKDTKFVKKTLEFGTSALMARLLNFGETQTARIVFATWYSLAILGYYNASFRIMEVLMLLTLTPVTNVAASYFAKHKNDQSIAQSELMHLLALSAVIAVPAMMGLGLLAHDIIFIVFGEKWNEAARYLAPISIVGMLLPLLLIFGDYILIMMGPKDRAITYGFGLCSAIAAGIAARFLTPIMYTYLISFQAFVMVLIMVFMARLDRAALDVLKSYIIPFACACIMGASLKTMQVTIVADLPPIERMATLIVTGVATYFLALAFLFPRFFGKIRNEIFGGIRRKLKTA
jgi:O-antigen/teichoic acid export membrane protein